MESRESCSAADGRAWKVDGRAQALVGPCLATPLLIGLDFASALAGCNLFLMSNRLDTCNSLHVTTLLRMLFL